MNLAVQIVRFVDEHQPGWVEVHFSDARGVRHIFHDKIPIFTDKKLGVGSSYPQPGHIRCEILSEVKESSGRVLFQIDTTHPDDLESIDGISEFVVDPTQLTKA